MPAAIRTVPSNDFIEFEHLNSPLLHWQTDRDKAASDCIITVENGTGNAKVYYAHLRLLSVSSDLFYRISISLESQKIQKVSTRVLNDSVTTGDIVLKLQDGSCFSSGKLSDPISSLKKQIQGLLGFSMADQRLFTCRGSVQDQELVDDWRSLASSGLSKCDTLLLIRRPWMQYDPETKSLQLQLPEPCARCLLSVSLCPLLVRQSLFLSYPALFPLVGSTRRRSLHTL